MQTEVSILPRRSVLFNSVRKSKIRLLRAHRSLIWRKTLPFSSNAFNQGVRLTMASKAIPENFLDLFSGKKAFANIATVMPDGSPQVTPIWFDYTNGKIRINTARGRVKDKNMKIGTKVALAIMDPANPYRYIQVRGPVVNETENGADAHIDSLAKKYMN